jgi:hypothetical protein
MRYVRPPWSPLTYERELQQLVNEWWSTRSTRDEL